jgi:hypothetical protein
MSEDPSGPPRPAEDTQRLNVPPPLRGGRRRRQLPTGVFVAFLVAGAFIGATAGVLFNRWWAARYQPGVAPPPATVGKAPPAQVAAPPSPTAEVVFNTTNVRPKATPEVLEPGAKEVYCFFTIPGEPTTADVTAWWLSAAGEPAKAEGQVVKEAGPELRGHVALEPPGKAKVFEGGIYEVALRVNGEEAADASFAMLKGSAELLSKPAGMDRYRPEVKDLVVFSGRAPASPGKPTVLLGSVSSVKVAFTYSHALSGTAFTVQWLYEDGLIQQATTEVVIKAAEGKGDAWFATKPPRPLPVGRYAVLISLGEGTPPLAREQFWIGRRPTAAELTKAG